MRFADWKKQKKAARRPQNNLLSVSKTLQAHGKETVYAVVAAPDKVASSGFDKVVRVWSPQNGQLLAEMGPHANLVVALKFASRGRYLVCGGRDGLVTVYDCTSWKRVGGFALDNGEPVSCVQVGGGTNDVVAIGGFAGSIKVVDVSKLVKEGSDPSELAALKGHNLSVTTCHFSGGCTKLVSGSLDATIRVWDLKTNRQQVCVEGHYAAITCVRFSPTGNQFASSSTCPDGRIKVWEAHNGSLVAELGTHMEQNMKGGSASAPYVNISLDGVADGDLPEYVEEEFFGHDGPVTRIEYSTDGVLVSAGMDATVRVWVPEQADFTSQGWSMHLLEPHQDTVNDIAVAPGSNVFATASDDGDVKLWSFPRSDIQTPKRKHSDGWSWGAAAEGNAPSYIGLVSAGPVKVKCLGAAISQGSEGSVVSIFAGCDNGKGFLLSAPDRPPS